MKVKGMDKRRVGKGEKVDMRNRDGNIVIRKKGKEVKFNIE